MQFIRRHWYSLGLVFGVVAVAGAFLGDLHAVQAEEMERFDRQGHLARIKNMGTADEKSQAPSEANSA